MQASEASMRMDDLNCIAALSIESAPPSLIRPILIGFVAAFVSIGGLVLWSFTTKLTSAVIVSGTVVAESGRKYIQHPTGGTVDRIVVKEGQDVSAGDTMLELDSSSMDIDYQSLLRLKAINTAALVRLRAEQDGLAELRFTDETGGKLEASAWLEIKHEQERMFKSRQSALSDKIEIAKSDGAEALAVVENIRAQIHSQGYRIALTEQELATAVHMAAQGYGTRQRVIEVQRALAELQSDLLNLGARRSDTMQNYERDKLQIQQYKADFLEGVQADFQTNQKENADLILKLRTIEQQRKSLTIKAPVSGRVVNLSPHTIGGVIMPGETILEVVPSHDPLVFEAEVRPEDISDVAVGQSVDVRPAGVEGQRTSRLLGKITLVSADRIHDTQKNADYFRVRAEIDRKSVGGVDTPTFRPGMEVLLMIRHGEHTPLAYLSTPLLEFFDRSLH